MGTHVWEEAEEPRSGSHESTARRERLKCKLCGVREFDVSTYRESAYCRKAADSEASQHAASP